MRSHSYTFSKKNQSKKLRSIMMVRCWDWKEFELKMPKLERISKWAKTENTSQSDLKQRLSTMMTLRDTPQNLTRKFTQMRNYQNNFFPRIHIKEINHTEINLKTNPMTNVQERIMKMDIQMKKRTIQIGGHVNTMSHMFQQPNSRNIRWESKIDFLINQNQRRIGRKINFQNKRSKNKITSNTENEKKSDILIINDIFIFVYISLTNCA